MTSHPDTSQTRAAAAPLALRASFTAAIVLVILALLLGAAAFGPSSAGASAATAARAAGIKPPIVKKYIRFGAGRKAQMADYSQHHYHQHTYLLTNPKAIVLHHTAGAQYLSAWNAFNNNTPYTIPGKKPEKPGVSAQFIVDKNGTIYQLMPLNYRARHCVGMNWKSFGIEFVQESAGHSGQWMDRQILNRPKQITAGLRLVRYLKARFGIKNTNVVGHATANESRFFKDYTGARNAAGDWFAGEVKAFRSRI